MKVNDKPRLHQSNAGQGVKMSIDEAATAHIMEVLTKLYSNPLLAVIREYSTNAWDSHKQAGVTEPISVTLPTALAPTLTIRDHGLGLNEDDIIEVYSRYGNSTKRDSNEAVGMLGLGCKSALSYTSQFTLEGRKDGVKTAVLISRDEDGAGSMTPVGIEDTDEPNGVTVHIPIKASDVSTASTLAAEFFRFWPEDDVLVNGNSLDASHKLDGIWLTDRILLTQQVKADLVVMGNVPYPLVDGEAPLFQHQSWSAVCFVGIGDVNFAPSREKLMTTRRTTACLAALRTKVTAEFERSIQDQIANATSAKEAQELLIKGRNMGFKAQAVYKGREVVLNMIRKAPTRIEKDWRGRDQEVPILSGAIDNWTVEDALKYSYLHTNERYYSRKSGDRSQSLDLRADGQFIFTGFDGKAMTNVKRAKLELWFAQNASGATTTTYNGSHLPHCVFVDKLSSNEKFWTTGWQVHDWADVAAIELPKAVAPDGTATRLKGSYDAMVRGQRMEGIAAATLLNESQTADLYWVQGNIWTGSRHRAFTSGALNESTSILVCLGANRIDKFCRDFPVAKKIDVAAKEAAERWVKNQDNHMRKAYAIQRRCNVDVLKTLPVADLDDPELRNLYEFAAKDTKSYVAAQQKFAYWVTDSGTVEGDRAVQAADNRAVQAADKLLSGYPLLNSMGRYDKPDPKHVVLYLNAVYNARQKGGI